MMQRNAARESECLEEAMRQPAAPSWNPVSAGTTDCACVTGKLRFARGTHAGVQRGRAPLRLLNPPRLGVWGLKPKKE